jgi:photosystem II 13kDa protein
MASIQFSRGIPEDTVPNIRMTRSETGNSGTATFYFESPRILDGDSKDEITGMYLIDDEGEMVTREVKGKFINGKASALEATIVMKTAEEWERFMRFMERYAEEQGMEFTKSS